MAWLQQERQQQQPLVNTGKPFLPKVFVAIPLPGAEVYTEFVMKSLVPILSPTSFCEKVVRFARGYSVVLARNTMVKQALEVNADYILWVDSDMVLDSIADTKTTDLNAALKLLMDMDAPISSGLYRAKKPEGIGMWAMWVKRGEKDGRPQFLPVPDGGWSGNWITVDTTGLGFCLMKTEVFKKLSQPYFHWETIDEFSEDFDMLIRAKKLGYDVKVRTDIRFRHLGVLGVNPDMTVTPAEL